jgi:shikimate dehydrogenase
VTSAIPYAEVIGDPVTHSLSPAIHRFWLGKMGLEGDYRATRIKPDELGDYFASRRKDPHWRGCNITMPLKLAALDHVQKPQDPSFPVEPVNLAVARDNLIIGFNTDVLGVMEPLSKLGLEPSAITNDASSAVVLGAGGALYPVVWTLLSLGFANIFLVARDPAKVATYLGSRNGVTISHRYWGDPLPACSLLINATPLGMEGFEALPYDATSVEAGGTVFDLVYRPLETALLRDARLSGLRTVDGLQMLVAQAAPSFAQFFGRSPPRQFDGELRGMLTA